MLAIVRKTGQVLLSGLLLLIATGSVARAQDPLPAPDLVSPPHQAVIYVDPTDIVTIDWTDVTGASSYEAQVFTSSDTSLEPMPFKSRVLNVSDFGLAAQALLDSIPAGETSKTFYWRARARNADGEGDWSDASAGLWEFTIDSGDNPNGPTLAPIGDQAGDEGTTIRIPVSATDGSIPPDSLIFVVDADTLTSQFMVIPVDSFSAIIEWTPGEIHGPGTYPITVTVIDDSADMFSDSETFNLTIGEVNDPPVLDPIDDQVAISNSKLTLTASASDPDIPANTLTFSLDATSASLGMTIDPLTGEFSWTPNESHDPGTYPVTVTVTDDGGLSDSEPFDITVPEDAMGPAIDPIDDLSIAEDDTTFALTVTATDGDMPADSLQFSLSSAPDSMTITGMDPNSAVIYWTPTEEDGPSDISITVLVEDGTGLTDPDSTTFVLTVEEVNQAPVLTAIDDQVAESNVKLLLTAIATDDDRPLNTLTYSLDPDAVALGMTIDPTEGVFSWTPDESLDPGNYSATITVTDNGVPALSDAESFNIEVPEAAQAPVLTAIADTTVNEMEVLEMLVTATDADLPPDGLDFSLIEAPDGMIIVPEGDRAAKILWEPTEQQGPGTFDVTVQVQDDSPATLSSMASFTVIVEEVNRPPKLDPITLKEADANVELTFMARARDPDLPQTD